MALIAILEPRLERAFRAGAVPDDVRIYGVRKAAQRWSDARQALTLFRQAGEPAGGLLVSERCQELIREFYGYKEDHVGGPTAVDHCLDALRYAVMGTIAYRRGYTPGVIARSPGVSGVVSVSPR
ncbi:orc1/cdc6 family replication initiation protein [Natronococcus jeotgali DSM 18795]|uniref:Orc1/cdc6 family replication initiation protein n=1 Tax=Natronococcus jeotgali DSM 18795 TaxID=1227498 RepID=L9X2G2_9EURY|nr:orc1/cdc6 family replication initiation protein [Natronococcus jeotgali DSM 18795]